MEKFHAVYEYSLYFKEHTLVWQHQKACLDANVSDLDESTMLMVMDFKENIKLPMELDQIGADFFNKEQRTIFNVTVFVKNEGRVEKTYHDVISKILNHDSHFVQHYVHQIIEQVSICMQYTHSRTSTQIHIMYPKHEFRQLVIWSDNCGGQFRNKMNLRFLETVRWHQCPSSST